MKLYTMRHYVILKFGDTPIKCIFQKKKIFCNKKKISPATMVSKNHLKDLHCIFSLISFRSDKSPTFPNLSLRGLSNWPRSKKDVFKINIRQFRETNSWKFGLKDFMGFNISLKWLSNWLKVSKWRNISR